MHRSTQATERVHTNPSSSIRMHTYSMFGGVLLHMRRVGVPGAGDLRLELESKPLRRDGRRRRDPRPHYGPPNL